MKIKAANFNWERVDRRGPDDCWPWTGAVNRSGYGAVQWRGKQRNASKAAYESISGEVPDGLMVCHTCDNPRCCNPGHLYVGTAKDNVTDKMERGRHRGGFAQGAAHPRTVAKLDEAMVKEVRARSAAGESYSAIGRSLGLTATTIRGACIRLTWKHVE